MSTFVLICKSFMSSFGDRLREERERLRLNQTELASVGGTTRKSQFNYETDARKPDAEYLAAAACAGVDVLYVLTGERDSGPASSLDAAEQVLLDAYRRCSVEAKRNLIQTAALFSAGLDAGLPVLNAAADSRRGMSNSGSGAVQVGHGGHYSAGPGSQHSSGAGAVNIGSMGAPPVKRRGKQ